MANRKMTNANKVALLTDWFVSPTNRGDILFFILTDVNGEQLVSDAFGKGLMIAFTRVDNLMGKIAFIDVLT